MPRRSLRPVDDLVTVERAMRLFLGALPRRLRFAEAARALAMTPDALLRAFERSRVNPRAHLRAARLERLDSDLRTLRQTKVSDALVRWGFPPASADALADYRTRYGCHAQETLDAALNRYGLAPRRSDAPS